MYAELLAEELDFFDADCTIKNECATNGLLCSHIEIGLEVSMVRDAVIR
jgi:hypothetical protein